MTTPEPKQNLTPMEAVAYLAAKGVQISYRTMKRWMQQGLVRVGRVKGRSRWVSRASLDEMAEGDDLD